MYTGYKRPEKRAARVISMHCNVEPIHINLLPSTKDISCLIAECCKRCIVLESTMGRFHLTSASKAIGAWYGLMESVYCALMTRPMCLKWDLYIFCYKLNPVR